MKPARKPAEPTVEQWLQDNPDRLLKPRNAATFLDLSEKRLRELRYKGEGPKHLVLENGYSIRYRLGELKRYAGLKVSA